MVACTSHVQVKHSPLPLIVPILCAYLPVIQILFWMQSHPTHVLLLAVCKLAVDPLQRHLFDRELEVSFGLLFFLSRKK